MKRQMTSSTTILAAAAAIALPATTAAAQDFSDDFESYPLGGGITQAEAWEEWCGSAGVDVTVTDEFANSGTQSIRADPGDDVVHRVNATSGVWVLSVQTYVPSSSFGNTFVIALNTYPDADCIGDFHWSLVVRLDADQDIVQAEFSGGETTPLIRDEWVEVRVVIDLDNDTHDIFYGDTLFVDDRIWSEAWTAGGATEFRALDLFSNDGVSYYDDVFIGPESATETVCPSDATINRGIEVGGGIGSLCESDDSDWSWQPDALAATVVAPINIQLDGVATSDTVSEMRVNVEVAATEPGVVQRIEIFNFAEELWEGTVFTNIATTDTVYTVTRTGNSVDFVGPDGEVRARVSYFRPAGVPPLWNVNIDQIVWEIDP